MGFKQQEMEVKSKESAAQREHDKQMRSMEIGGQMDAEMAKNPELMGSLTSNISKGLEAVAASLGDGLKTLGDGVKTLGDGQQQLAQALMAPKVSTMSPDGMTATTRPA
jgi:hypothetical protein